MLFLIVRAISRQTNKKKKNGRIIVKKLLIEERKENQTLTELIEEKLKAKNVRIRENEKNICIKIYIEKLLC